MKSIEVLTRRVTRVESRGYSIVRLPSWWLDTIGVGEAFTAILLEDRIIITSPSRAKKMLLGV